MDRSGHGWAPSDTCAGGCDGRTARSDAANGARGRVLVVEEHGLLAAGMQLALARRCWHAETATGPTPADVMDQARVFEADVALIDVCHGFGSSGIGKGIDLIRPLRSTGARVVMLTAERRRTALAEFLEAGAAGWIRKTAPLEEVHATLARVVAGESIIGRAERETLLDRLRDERVQARRAGACFDHLTHREALVLAALVDGLSAEEIAREHVVAVTTVRSQIRAVLNKLGVRSQLAAVAAVGSHRALLPQRADAVRDRRRVSLPDVGDDASGGVEHSA